MPVGRPRHLETPEIIRQIPRATHLDTVEAPEAPPADPPEPFFWAEPSEPDPGRLRPISALIGDTFSFAVRNLRSVLVVALPAVVALAILWPAYRWAYRPIFDEAVDGDIGLRLALVGLVGGAVGVIGSYLFTTALANLVVQSDSDGTVAPGAALRLAARRLPRLITANLIYGLLVFAVFAAPLFFLQLYLLDRELTYLMSWCYLVAGVVAYAAPQINVYFTAIKIEERRPRFRRAADSFEDSVLLSWVGCCSGRSSALRALRRGRSLPFSSEVSAGSASVSPRWS